MNAGRHTYDQGIESRVGQGRTTNKAFRIGFFANEWLPRKERLTAWKALTFSKSIFHAATWGTLTVDNLKIIGATHQQGLRIIHGSTNYVALQYGTRTNLGVRADLKVPTIQQSISARRLGLLKRHFDCHFEWLLGLIVASWDQYRGWAIEVQKDLKWLARLETGVSPTGTSL